MKIPLLVLSIIVSVFGSGCAVTALTGNPVPAALEVTNNVEGTYMTFHTNRSSDFGVKIPTGGTARIPVCGLPPGSSIIVTAKFWDPLGRYLGTSIISTSVWLDQGGRFSQSVLVDYIQQPTKLYARN